MTHFAVDDNFKWGGKLQVKTNNNDVTFYNSFTYHDVEYALYDCVYMHRERAKETDVGKIIKMWSQKKANRVKILWFFRPIDISPFLKDYEPSWNELFLGSGVGKGLCNIISPEAIIGKCSVICTSKDSRNSLPSKSDLGKAVYFFSHSFDVGSLTISEKFPDKIDAVKVECLFNRYKTTTKANVECRTAFPAQAKDLRKSVDIVEKDRQVGTADLQVSTKDTIVKDETSRTSEDFVQYASETRPLKKRKLEDSASLLQNKVEDPTSILDPLPAYSGKSARKVSSDSSNMLQSSAVGDKETSQPEHADCLRDTAVQTSHRIRPAADPKRWMHNLSWEERINFAREKRALVFLDNLDPLYTSSDVQDMILSAFKISSEAKIIPHGSYSSPSYGQALVVFESKHEADFVISELTQKCLVVGEGRTVFACRSALKEPPTPSNFLGHLIIEKLKKMRRNEEWKKAVSTSHCSQPNTIQYDMALQWRMLQARSDLWWSALHQIHANRISKCQKQLKICQPSQHATAERSTHAVTEKSSPVPVILVAEGTIVHKS